MRPIYGRTEADAGRLWDAVPEATRGTEEAAAMDKWQAFVNATLKAVPSAEIVHDKFHISKHPLGNPMALASG